MNKDYWNRELVDALFNLPFIALVQKAYTIHCSHFAVDEIELCTLLSIKTGSCPEDCAYCPQSGHYNTGLEKQKILDIQDIVSKAQEAKANGAVRFCMGAAWKKPSKKDFPKVLEAIKAVKKLELETCVTLGSLDSEQANELKEAGLDFYNHNLDTSPEYYKKIITTRTYQDRIDTINHVVNAAINVCCGGIIGMGETKEDRIEFLLQIANLPETPKSIPINRLIPIKGTPLENIEKIDNFDFIKTIAVTRIMFPSAMIRLSAGREEMSEEMQVLCFMAGANSVFYGSKLLTAGNPNEDVDLTFFKKLGIKRKMNYAK
jgi:biotin synthase